MWLAGITTFYISWVELAVNLPKLELFHQIEEEVRWIPSPSPSPSPSPLGSRTEASPPSWSWGNTTGYLQGAWPALVHLMSLCDVGTSVISHTHSQRRYTLTKKQEKNNMKSMEARQHFWRFQPPLQWCRRRGAGGQLPPPLLLDMIAP